MGEYDVVVRGGIVVEATGTPRYKGDIGIKNGRIAKISGRIPAGSAREIDAGGCIVAPGAINLHTHYDAQLNWDPYCTLDGWFGQTTITIGQCGFGFAPTRSADRDLNMRMMNRIEAIPLDSMMKGMRWDWETYPEYLDSLDRQGLGVNVASLLPFSPLRGYVLGMIAARQNKAVTKEQLNRMKEIFRDGMRAGSFGFAADMNAEDRCEDGSPIPSQVASDEEYLALAGVLGEFGVGCMGWTVGVSPNQSHQYELLTKMMQLSGRPLHVVLGHEPGGPEWVKRMRAQGFPVAPQKTPLFPQNRFTLAEFNLFDYMPNWVDPFIGTAAERQKKLSNPKTRAAMKQDIVDMSAVYLGRTDWRTVRVLEVVHERNFQYEGKTIETIAKMTGKHPVDVFIDLAIDEDLQTEFGSREFNVEAEKRIDEGLLDPYTHISTSDGGAHVRFQANARWPVDFLAYWIREREIMTLEQAHHKMSAYPAWILGIPDRGSIRVGAFADLMVYNFNELGLENETPVYSNDFPGGERRLVQKPKGMRYIIVNGGVTFENNQCSNQLPGKLLRSYDMAH